MKEQATYRFNNMDESQKYYDEGQKPAQKMYNI